MESVDEYSDVISRNNGTFTVLANSKNPWFSNIETQSKSFSKVTHNNKYLFYILTIFMIITIIVIYLILKSF